MCRKKIELRKTDFTLAKGAKHVALPTCLQKAAFTLAEFFSPHPTSSGKVAFTLAEVLITLGIIGVVAAMTLPNLIGNYQKAETVSRLKKVYSSLMQSVDLSKVQYGDIADWDWDLDAYNFFIKYLANNFNVMKNCGNKAGCWNDFGAYMISGGLYSDNPLNSYWYKISLSDGTFIALQKQDNTHIHITVDTNGKKKPNRYGKDIFVMTMTAKNFKDAYHNINNPGLYMFGHGYDRDYIVSESLGCGRTKAGLMCGALLLIDNWQIKDDYPW